jgi:uncharacterized membrane protein YuzA (DUF378 family)
VEFMKRFEPVWLALVLLGALNWALIALFDFNVVEEILGTGTATDVVYVIVGLAAVALLPRMLEGMHLGDRAHPRGAQRTDPRRAGGAHPAQPDSSRGVRLAP